ncbi:MAG: transcriptional repressor NrdR [Actinobacteria bacterium]|nr:transcriptional repressor NrdR [Actinomycetota bacterium]
MRCPVCSHEEDKVVDSRVTEDGRAIRRRRECLSCASRYTTFERIEDAPLMVIKRSGEEVSFDRQKIAEGLRMASKNRPVDATQIEAIVDEVEQKVRSNGKRTVTSAEIGREVLDRLRALDDVAYLRFASVYKGFQELTDFEKELLSLLQRNKSG